MLYVWVAHRGWLGIVRELQLPKPGLGLRQTATPATRRRSGVDGLSSARMRGQTRLTGTALGLALLALLALFIPVVALKLVVITAIAAALIAAVLVR